MKTIFLSLLLAASLAGAAQNISGKLQFQKGQRLEVTTNATSTMQAMMGESATTSSSTEILEVKETGATGTVLERSMKNLKLKLSLMGQERTVDSDKPEDLKGTLGEPVKEMLSTKTEMSIDAFGTVTAVKADGNKKGDAGGMGMLLQQANINAGVPTVGSASLFKVLPAQAVAKGDRWLDSVAVAGTTTLTTYTLKDITDTEVLIDFTSDGKIDTKQEMMGMSMDVKGTVKSTGLITLDRATGLLKQKTTNAETETATSLSGQELAMTAKTTSTITVKTL